MTPAALIDALGGCARVAAQLHRSPQAVANWRVRGIPAAMDLPVWRLASAAGLAWQPARLAATSLPAPGTRAGRSCPRPCPRGGRPTGADCPLSAGGDARCLAQE
jgi:hypothetical protein